MVVIDLGDRTGPLPLPPPIDRGRIRRALLATLAVLGVVMSGGSARPAPPWLHAVWSTPLADGDEASFGEDTGYVSRPRQGRVEMTAYALATGRIRWTGTVDDAGPIVPEPLGDVVLLRTGPVSVERDEPDGSRTTTFFYRTTIALDAATGAERWRAAGEQGATSGGQVLLGEHDDEGRLERLRLIDAADGRVRWSRAVPDARSWTITEAGEVLTIGADGRVTFLSFADGSVLRDARLPGPLANIGYTDGYLLAGAVPTQNPPADVTTIYRASDLARLWSVDTTEGGVIGCGPLLCSLNAESLVAHDPATGRELWRQPGKRAAEPIGPDRLLLFDQSENGDDMLVETRTGRPVGEPAAGQVIWSPITHGSALLLKHTEQPTGLVSVTRLDLTTGRRTLLGAIGPVLEVTCWDLGRYLACPASSRLTVMEVG